MVGAYDIKQPAVGIRHDRGAAQLRLDGHQPQPLLARRYGQQARALIERDQGVLRERAVPAHAIGETESAGARFQGIPIRSIANYMEHRWRSIGCGTARRERRRRHRIEQVR